MCLIVFAWKCHPDYRLILAANRDEFHARPSREADWWADQPDILAGRDLQAGGTWLATNRSGRFATVTNYREQQRVKPGNRSRGEIATNFVSADVDPLSFVSSITDAPYAGVSVLAADQEKSAMHRIAATQRSRFRPAYTASVTHHSMRRGRNSCGRNKLSPD
jgi:uncharacterized protein with NRDE domain